MQQSNSFPTWDDYRFLARWIKSGHADQDDVRRYFAVLKVLRPLQYGIARAAGRGLI